MLLSLASNSFSRSAVVVDNDVLIEVDAEDKAAGLGAATHHAGLAVEAGSVLCHQPNLDTPKRNQQMASLAEILTSWLAVWE